MYGPLRKLFEAALSKQDAITAARNELFLVCRQTVDNKTNYQHTLSPDRIPVEIICLEMQTR